MEDRFENQSQVEKYIQTAYNRGGHYLVDGKPKYNAQAVRMEDEFGLKGIARRFTFINSEEPEMAEYRYRKNFLKYAIASEMLKSGEEIKRNAAQKFVSEIPTVLNQINQEISDLKELNPDLKRLNYDKRNYVEAYRALIGVTSQYNVDDINAYLHSYRSGEKDKAVLAEMERLKAERGVRFGWQPAMSTIKKIDQQFKVRDLAIQHKKCRL